LVSSLLAETSGSSFGMTVFEASSQSKAVAEVERGIASHKKGDLAAAVDHYEAALVALGVSWDSADAEIQLGKGLATSTLLSDTLHFLGAVQVQRVEQEFVSHSGDDDDDDDVERHGQNQLPTWNRQLGPDALTQLQKSIALMHAAKAALPLHETDCCKRGRLLNSTGAACFLLGPVGWSEATLELRGAVTLMPGAWAPRSNLVRVLGRLIRDANGSEKQALQLERTYLLEEMSRIRPGHPGIWYRLGMALRHAGRLEEAITALEANLNRAAKAEAIPATQSDSHDSGNRQNCNAVFKVASTKHWLAVLRGDNPATAPAEYVASLFDNYAERFEEHLVGKLQYNTPARLADALGDFGSLVSGWQRCADLGCGTGLMGPSLRSLGFRGILEGVDLSEGMLVQARAKGGPGIGYDRLLCGDILDLLTADEVASQGLFDLVIAADVFVYIGDLSAVFRRASECLTHGGVFAFSTEAPRPGECTSQYRLTETGRFKHDPVHLARLGDSMGLTLHDFRAVVLRMDAGKPVNGHVHVMTRTS